MHISNSANTFKKSSRYSQQKSVICHIPAAKCFHYHEVLEKRIVKPKAVGDESDEIIGPCRIVAKLIFINIQWNCPERPENSSDATDS